MIRSAISVNAWRRQTPSVDEVRPARCVACGAASRPAGGGLAIHGHGLRSRLGRGPPAPEDDPIDGVLVARRYRCCPCHAVMIVVPSEIVPRRHYAATAIAFALGLYGLADETHAEIRSRVSPSKIVGVCAEYRWVTLSRWIDAVLARDLFVSLPAMPEGQPRRAVATRAAMAIGAHAPPSLQECAPAERAFFGVAHMA